MKHLVIGITDKADSKVCNEEEVIYTLLCQYSYGVPFDLRVGVRNQLAGLTEKEDYKIYTVNDEVLELTLYEKFNEVIAKDTLTIYRFVPKIFTKLLDNILPNGFTLEGVSFKEYVTQRENQLDFFTFGLRKKGKILIVDEKGIFASVHIQKKLHEEDKNYQDNITIVPLVGENYKAKNYYTMKGGSKIGTKNGLGDSIFLPFATKEDIAGLDNLLVPTYELWTDITPYQLGDVVTVDDENTIIIEKESFFYGGASKTYMVSAKKV